MELKTPTSAATSSMHTPLQRRFLKRHTKRSKASKKKASRSRSSRATTISWIEAAQFIAFPSSANLDVSSMLGDLLLKRYTDEFMKTLFQPSVFSRLLTPKKDSDPSSNLLTKV